MAHTQSELQVITFAKNLCSYVMTMWVPQDDAEARPFMMEALRTLSVPEN